MDLAMGCLYGTSGTVTKETDMLNCKDFGPKDGLKLKDAAAAYYRLAEVVTRAEMLVGTAGYGERSKELFESLFGPYTGAKKAKIHKALRAIYRHTVVNVITFHNSSRRAEKKDGERRGRLLDPNMDEDDFAYVDMGEDHRADVYLGPAFFEYHRNATDTTVGTTIHELSHLVAGTEDYAYGRDGCETLAKTSPDRAIKNADSYQYFCELAAS